MTEEKSKKILENIELFPLYHGTDLRFVEMSKDERDSFKTDCIQAAQYLWKIFQPFYDVDENKNRLELFKQPLNYDQDKTKWLQLYQALNLCSAWRYDNEQYQYDCIHLTTIQFKAENYAIRSRAFGEIGAIIYHIYNAVQSLDLEGFSPDNKIQKTINRVMSFGNDVKNFKPVIFQINDLDYRNIRFEHVGNIIEAIDKYGLNLRNQTQVIHYYGDLCFDPKKAIHVK